MTNDKPPPGTVVYRASPTLVCEPSRVRVWVDDGIVSQCGEWVDAGEARYPLTAAWQTTRAAAEAATADSIANVGQRYLAQADELRGRVHA